METLPGWMADLAEEDLAFIKKFIMSSGSLKEVAALYGVQSMYSRFKDLGL